MDTQHATHARDETQANDSSQADAVEPGQKIKPATAGDLFDTDSYRAAIRAAEDFSKSELSNYNFRVSMCKSKALIEQLPFVRTVNVVTKANGARTVKRVLKYWAPTYKAGRTFDDKQAAFEVGMGYGLMLAHAFREGAHEDVVQRVIREAYAAHVKTRDHYGSLVGGFICQIENQTIAGMQAPKVIL